MSLKTRVGYPVGFAAALVGALRQIQRWLPRYEWIMPNQWAAYTAGINISALIVGTVGVFLVGIGADWSLDHRWSLSKTVGMALGAAVGGLAFGTALTFLLHPGFNEVLTSPLIAFVWPMAVYVLTEGVPIGVAAIAGLAMSRIYATESATAGRSNRSVSRGLGSDATARTETETDAEPLSVSDADSAGSGGRLGGSSR